MRTPAPLWLARSEGCTCPFDPELHGGCPACREPDDDDDEAEPPHCTHPRHAERRSHHQPDDCPV